MRRSRLAVFAAVVALAAGGGTAYVVTRASDGHRSTATEVSRAPRADVLPALATAPVPTATGVRSALRRLARAPAFGGSLTGFVVDARSGATLFARGADRPMTPASTAKLLTAVAALDLLGSQSDLSTGVIQDGRRLYLVGGGDVTLTVHPRPGYPPTATLDSLARRTAASIDRSAPVRLRYDADAWSGPDLAPGWTPGYLSSGNVSRLSPLEVDGGRLSAGATAPRAADPAKQAALAFRAALRRAGVHVVGTVRSGAAPASALGVAAVHSPAIGVLVQRMLTDSDNDLAEALGRLVARRAGEPATFAGAGTAVVSVLRRLALPTTGVRLYDASGLSRLDRVTARMLVELLRKAALAAHPEWSVVAAGLPVAGFTGTLDDRYRKGARRDGRGVVRAKTGTLVGVNALAGQVVDRDGDLLVFAFLAGHVADPVDGERALDALAARLAGCGCH